MSAVHSLDDATDLDHTLRLVARGDRNAFAELYQSTSARLFAICLRMLRQRSDAEDALQDIFITVWKRASTYDSSHGNPMAWLVAIARSKAIDRLRAGKKDLRNITLDPDAPFIDPAPPVEDVVVSSDEAYRLDACLSSLEDKQRDAIEAAFIEGSTHNELAEQMAVPLGTMKSWIRRGLIQLRTCLER